MAEKKKEHQTSSEAIDDLLDDVRRGTDPYIAIMKWLEKLS